MRIVCGVEVRLWLSVGCVFGTRRCLTQRDLDEFCIAMMFFDVTGLHPAAAAAAVAETDD